MLCMNHYLRAGVVIVGLALLCACPSRGKQPIVVSAVETPENPAPDNKVVTDPDGFRLQEPVACTGDETLELKKVRIDAQDVAVTVEGSCQVVIEDSLIAGGDVAVVVSDTGSVTIRNSTIQGRGAAFALSETGDLTAEKTRFIGGRMVTETGVFHDGGDNTWE